MSETKNHKNLGSIFLLVAMTLNKFAKKPKRLLDDIEPTRQKRYALRGKANV